MHASKRIESITIWRVIACLGVFTVHLGQRMELSGIIRMLTDFGKYGVQLFFIISGYLGWRTNVLGGGQTTSYWCKRAIRILPLYYLVILYYFLSETFIWGAIPSDDTGFGWTRYLFFLSGFVKSDTYFWSNLGITWTIPVFVLFYFMAPFLFRLVKNYGRSLVLYVILVGIAWGIGAYCNGNLAAFTYLPFFAEGIILYYTKKEKKEPLTIFLALVGLIGQLILGHIDSTTYSLIFIIMLIVTWDITIPWKRVKRFVCKFDEYSYTIYLVHGLIFCGFIDKYAFQPAVVLGIAVFGTGLAVFIIYNFIEHPIQKILERKYREWKGEKKNV